MSEKGQLTLDERIQQIQERRAAITSGHWRHCKDDKCICGIVSSVEMDVTVHAPVMDFYNEGIPLPDKEHAHADSVFIAHAPQDIDFLLATIDELLNWEASR